MQTTKLSTSLKLAAASAALAVCGASYAAADSAPAAQAATAVQESSATTPATHMGKMGKHHKHMHRQLRDAAMWVPGYGPLDKDFVQSLALTDKQSTALEAAKAVQKEARAERRAAFKTAMKARAEQAKSGKIDPRAALKQTEEAQGKAQAERRSIDEKWLAVWDTLDPSQQQKVAAHFSERAEKFAKRADKRKGHREQAAPAAEKASS
jgi:Spy/CpxP family protein refolding chaperone